MIIFFFQCTVIKSLKYNKPFIIQEIIKKVNTYREDMFNKLNDFNYNKNKQLLFRISVKSLTK